MYSRFLLIVAAVLAIAADAPKGDAAKEENKKLEGSWKLVSLELNGNPGPPDPEEFKRSKWSIKGDRLVREGDERTEELVFEIDPTKKPKTMDLRIPGAPTEQSMAGIYSLASDDLKICFVAPGKTRPKDNESGILFVFKREKG
jgi:uncharacterized protein (TIGR03067 family)